MNNARAAARKLITDGTTAIREYQPSQLYRELDRTDESIARFASILSDSELDAVSAVRAHVQAVRMAFDRLVSSKFGLPAFVDLIHCGAQLHTALVSARTMLRLVRDGIASPKPTLPEGDDMISFGFEGPVQYDDLISRLTALRELYRVICEIAGVPVEDHPLRMVHLETGSIVIEIAGYAAVLYVMRAILADAALIYQHYFTPRGRQLLKLEEDLAAFEIAAGVRDALVARDIDPEKVERGVRSAAADLTKAVQSFVGETLTSIDGKRVATTARALSDNRDEKRRLPAPPDEQLVQEPPPAESP